MQTKRNTNNPEQVVQVYRYKLKKTVVESDFNEFDDDEIKFEIFDYYYSDIDSDSDVESKDTNQLIKPPPKAKVEFNYSLKGKVYDITNELQRKTDRYLRVEASYLVDREKKSSTNYTLYLNFHLFLEKFFAGLIWFPIFQNVGSILSIREEIAMFTLKFLMAENDYCIVKDGVWDFVIENNKKRNILHEKNGYSKKIYHLLVDLMNAAFTPTLEYKSNEFRDIFSTNKKLDDDKEKTYKGLFSYRDCTSKYIAASFYNSNTHYSTPLKEIKNISLNKIVFPTPQNPHEVFQEEKVDVLSLKEIAKNIIYNNLDFFKAAFDLENPDLFQKWAKAHINEIKPLSDSLRYAINKDILTIQNRAELAEALKKRDAKLKAALRAKPSIHQLYVEDVKKTMAPYVSHAKQALDLIIEYMFFPSPILQELENVIPGKDNFESVLHIMHQALKKAEKTRVSNHILSGFYAYNYHINNLCINRKFLNYFVYTIVQNKHVIDNTAKKWRHSMAPQRLFSCNLASIGMYKNNPALLQYKIKKR